MDCTHPAVMRCADLMLHLHGLQHQQCCSTTDNIPWFHRYFQHHSRHRSTERMLGMPPASATSPAGNLGTPGDSVQHEMHRPALKDERHEHAAAIHAQDRFGFADCNDLDRDAALAGGDPGYGSLLFQTYGNL